MLAREVSIRRECGGPEPAERVRVRERARAARAAAGPGAPPPRRSSVSRVWVINVCVPQSLQRTPARAHCTLTSQLNSHSSTAATPPPAQPATRASRPRLGVGQYAVVETIRHTHTAHASRFPRARALRSYPAP
jgi:hypothetical protein